MLFIMFQLKLKITFRVSVFIRQGRNFSLPQCWSGIYFSRFQVRHCIGKKDYTDTSEAKKRRRYIVAPILTLKIDIIGLTMLSWYFFILFLLPEQRGPGPYIFTIYIFSPRYFLYFLEPGPV